MIFADIEYQADYRSFHEELDAFVHANFSHVQSGIQGDSWIWIFDGEMKVAIDTFSSMKHQIKSDVPGRHVQQVIDILRSKYRIKIYRAPELETHEDA
jgi:hypothetical protein